MSCTTKVKTEDFSLRHVDRGGVRFEAFVVYPVATNADACGAAEVDDGRFDHRRRRFCSFATKSLRTSRHLAKSFSLATATTVR